MSEYSHMSTERLKSLLIECINLRSDLVGDLYRDLLDDKIMKINEELKHRHKGPF